MKRLLVLALMCLFFPVLASSQQTTGPLKVQGPLTVTGTVTTNVKGSTQCVHANSAGVITGTGQECGNGVGVPALGTGGQVLEKNSGANYDMSWQSLPQLGVAYTWDLAFFIDIANGANFQTTAVPLNANLQQIVIKPSSGTLSCSVYPAVTITRTSDGANLVAPFTMPTGISSASPLVFTSFLTALSAGDAVRFTTTARGFLCVPSVLGTYTSWVANSGSNQLPNALLSAGTDFIGGVKSLDCSSIAEGDFVEKINPDGSITCASPTGSLPSQAAQTGKVLTTNGTTAAWTAGIPIYNCKQLAGVVCDGTAEGVAFQSALDALNNGTTTHGGIVQLAAGEIPNMGTTAITVPIGVQLRGTGLSIAAVGFTSPLASSYITTNCSDTNGCIKFVAQGSGSVENLTVVNNGSSPCFFITKTVMNPFLASCIGSAGSNSTNNAVNDMLQLGEPGTTTCTTDEHCYYVGYNAEFNLFGRKIRRYIVANAVAQMFEYTVHVDSTSSNANADANVIAGTCNDAGAKCGFTSLACASGATITLAITGGATGTVACTALNAIADGTDITITYPGNSYTSAPTTAACSGTCTGTTGTASLSTVALGPMVDLIGDAIGSVIQTRGTILGEAGNPGSHVNPGDAHYSSAVHCSTHCGQNNALAMIDDSSTVTPAWADFNQEPSAQSNHFECWYRQTSAPAVPCHSPDGSYANLWDDPASSTREARTLKGTHLGTAGFPFNDGNIAVALRAGSGVTDQAGKQAASGGTMTYSFTGSYSNAPACVVQDDTTIANLLTKTVTSTTLTVTTTGATDSVSWNCWPKG